MTGIIVSTPPTTSLPPSNASNNPVGLPGVTYQYALLNLPQTWGAKQTFPLGNISLNAADITGTLPFGVLPFPSPSTLGGIQSASPVAHNWINSISTSGVPSLSQPAFSDISGTVTASQLPNPTASTLGGIESIAAVSHKWINTISTTGVPTQTQPDAVDVSFTQTGTGAVATNLSSKTSQIISVLDFGAVGNGVTDDRLAIQRDAIRRDALFPSHGEWLRGQPS